MRRSSLVCGGFLVVLGAVALLEALRMRDAWTGAPLVPALYVAMLPSLGFLLATALFALPLVRGLGGWSWPATLATTMGIRK